MKNISFFYDLLSKSNVSLLGYSYEQERIKDQIISKLPNVIISEVNIQNFSFAPYIRDMKIDSVIGDSKLFEYFIIDLNDIVISREDRNLGRPSAIRYFVEKVRESLIIFNEINQTNYRVLFLTNLNRNLNSSSRALDTFAGGNGPIVIADLVFAIQEKTIKIVKNRFGNDGDDILINFENENNNE